MQALRCLLCRAQGWRLLSKCCVQQLPQPMALTPAMPENLHAPAGYSGVIAAQVNTHYVLLPIPVITQAPRRVDPHGKAWRRVRSALHQPSLHDASLPDEDESLAY